MKIRILILGIIIFLSVKSFCQSGNTGYFKHEAGIQINPLFDEGFRKGYRTYITSAVYLFHANKYLSFGPRVSYSYSQLGIVSKGSSLDVGLISRVNYNKQYRLNPFIEIYTGTIFSKYHPEPNIFTPDTTLHHKGFSYYVAPGLKYQLNRNFSVDLMCKFSTKQLYNIKNAVFSWRFCYSFGKME